MQSHKKLELKRSLGLFQTTIFGVGVILGAGIYVLVGVASGVAGNAVWISFALASLVAIFTGFSYAELSSMFPDDAAEYSYAEHAFGRAVAFFVGYWAFLAQVIMASAVSLGFAGYVSRIFGVPGVGIIAAGLIILVSLVNIRGIAQSSALNVICTLLEIAGLMIIIIIGLPRMGSTDLLAMADGLPGIFHGAALVFFAYIGFEGVVKLAEETKNPTKTIPHAVLLAIAISTILYILVAISAVSVIDWHELALSKAPLADVAAIVLGSKAFTLIAFIALFSTANTVLIALVAGSRALYGVARRYRGLSLFGFVHRRFQTPYVAIALSMVLALLFLIPRDIATIAEYCIFGIFLTFIVVNAAVIAMRFKGNTAVRGFTIPLAIAKVPVIPVLGIGTTLFLLFNLQREVILGGLLYSSFGLLIYFLVRNRAIIR